VAVVVPIKEPPMPESDTRPTHTGTPRPTGDADHTDSAADTGSARFADPLRDVGHVDHMMIHPDGRLAIVRTTGLADDDSLLPVLQHGVGGLIERVTLRGDLDAWANEEGVLLSLPFNPVAAAVCAELASRPAPPGLCGTVLILGTDGETGVSLTADQQRQVIEAWQAVTGHPHTARVGHRPPAG
jgi:hypothetical protein